MWRYAGPAAAARSARSALRTSDRMLLYYFQSRDQLLEAARSMSDAAVSSQLEVWIEVVALAGRGGIACKRVAGAVTTQGSEWVSRRLQIPKASKSQAAAAILAVVDGLVRLQLSGRHDLARDAERFLHSALTE